MPSPNKPSFIEGKNCCRKIDFDPIEHYREIAKGIYEWDGFPEDLPDDYIESVLFDYGQVGAKYVDGLGIVVSGAATVFKGLQGQTLTWRPIDLIIARLPPNINVTGESSTPTLNLGMAMKDRIEMKLDIIKQSYISLRQNMIALRQPIGVKGRTGAEADGLIFKIELEEGEMYIPVLDISSEPGAVIDLKAHDWSGSIINTINAMDNEILTELGVQNTGTEKASGMAVEEVTSIHQELRLISKKGLRKREKWCNRINPILGTNFSVKLSEAYEEKIEAYSEVLGNAREERIYPE